MVLATMTFGGVATLAGLVILALMVLFVIGTILGEGHFILWLFCGGDLLDILGLILTAIGEVVKAMLDGK